jgi:uncharacterized membrane protein YjfL (UPF0719 family)
VGNFIIISFIAFILGALCSVVQHVIYNFLYDKMREKWENKNKTTIPLESSVSYQEDVMSKSVWITISLIILITIFFVQAHDKNITKSTSQEISYSSQSVQQSEKSENTTLFNTTINKD